MIGYVFAGITLSAGIMATFVGNMKRAILALWVVGLGIGAIYLTVGAEFLAIVQWLVSTLVTVSFIFFSVMFGEYHAPHNKWGGSHPWLTFLSLGLGTGFAVLIGRAAKELPETSLVLSSDVADLRVLGRVITHDNLLSLEVLALVLFLVLVGGGVVARSDGGDS